MFMLEEHRYQQKLAKIIANFVCPPGRCQSAFWKINIKILTDLLGSTNFVAPMVSGKDVRKCVFSESLHSDPCYPKPIYGIQYNFIIPGTRSCESSSMRS